MPLEARLALALALALALVYSATPLAIKVADRLEFYDKPAGYKGHIRPTPYLGGAAVMAGFVLVLLVFSTEDLGRTAPLLGGMAVLWGVGTLDDRRMVSPALRVGTEVALACCLWALGLGWNLGAGSALDLALTIVWIVAVVNAFNLFDNMDGAASTMALVTSAGVVAIAWVYDDPWLAIAAATLCGACLGFLPHNLASPARIFLGDGGSMPIGFAVAALAMIGSAEAVPAWQALVVGLLLVAIPALDTCLVMVSRRRRGISILTAGRDHLTHRTQRRLRTARGVAMGLGAIQALVSALALFAVSGGASAIILILVLYFIAGATAIALLEAQEREQEAAVTVSTGTAIGPATRRTAPSSVASVAIVAAFGAALGTSAFVGGFYDEGKWIPIGLALLTVATATAIARVPRATRPAVLSLAALVGLAGWALLSSAWAPSVVDATTEANRWFVLAAILATALALIRTELAAAWLTGALAAGIGAVAVYVLVHLLGTHPNQLFLGGRLNQPLGYINAEATVFIMGFWLCFSVVERRSPVLAGAGAGTATLMACLALLSGSRGAALAVVASVLVVVLLVPGSRLRRIFGLLAVTAGVAAAAPTLLHVYEVGAVAPIVPQVGHEAAIATLVASALVGIVWGVGVRLHALGSVGSPSRALTLDRAGKAILAAGCVAVLAFMPFASGSIANEVSDQWFAFVHLSERPGGATAADPASRLVSGAGNRYDYWRVAWDAFRQRPLVGVGAGNYDRPYFRARHTAEDVRQPHSIEFQELSELGIIGGALLICFVAGVGMAAWKMRPIAAASPLAATLMVGGVGAFTTWFVHTSVDWMHLMPGITGIALSMAAVLMLDRRRAGGESVPVPAATGGFKFPIPALAAACIAGLALVVSAGSLSRQGLADFFRTKAQNALATDPAGAIREANRSLRLDGENPRTYYVKAAALARFNAADASRKTLLEAASKEPDNFVTWTLLGDLAVRRERFDEARRNYARAYALNPEDPALKALAENPRNALGP